MSGTFGTGLFGLGTFGELEEEVSPAASILYEALDPAFTQYDSENGYAVLRLCQALTVGDLDFIYEIVTDSDLSPGWQILLDPDRAPVAALPYLAQFAGAILRPDMDEEAQRNAIKSPEAFGRGTLAQLIAVAQRRLTGSKAVVVTERYTGDAWRVRIETLTSETPEPARTEAEVLAEAKPIGILMFFNTRVAWTWLELRAEEATWLKVREDFATWHDVRTHEP